MVMEAEVLRLFHVASKAADAVAIGVNDGGGVEEEECLHALMQLKNLPVNSQVLVSTQVGKGLRRLTKHPRKNIQALASDLIQIWKQVVLEESNTHSNKESMDEDQPKENAASKVLHKPEIKKSDSVKARKMEPNGTPRSEKKVEDADVGGSPGQCPKVETAVNKQQTPTTMKPCSNSVPLKPACVLKCNDPVRDRVRELLVEALSRVSGEAGEDIIDEVNASDPVRVAVAVETVMFNKWGKMNGSQKIKYRSLMFNIKDGNNPDFRRKILLGRIDPESLVTLSTEEMASDQRQRQNEQIKQKALVDCELGAAPKATTDQFKCGRCGQRRCTYYQMQTRSADEPMTTYVTCVNCNNHWKFC